MSARVHRRAGRARSSAATARCWSAPARAPARRRCWSSASCGPCSRTACAVDVDPGHHLHREGRRAADRPGAARGSLELGDREERAREAEAAWISTIHGFCARVLRTHALAAGIDPEFRVLDALEAERLAIDAFDRALARLRGHRPRTRAGWRCWPPTRRTSWPTWCAPPTRTCAARASAARGCRRSTPPRRRGPARGAGGRRGAAALAELGAARRRSRPAARAAELERCARCWRRSPPDEVAEPARAQEAGLQGHAPRCSRARRARPTARPTTAYLAYCAALPRAQRPRAAARADGAATTTTTTRSSATARASTSTTWSWSRATCCRPTRACATQYRERFTHVMVDEFQDTNPLQNELLGAARARQPVPRRRRAPVDLRLPPRRREGVPPPPGEAARRGPGRAR